MSSAEKETGRSMAKILRTWSRSVLTGSDRAKYDEISCQHTILHDIADNAKFVKVTTATFCTKRLLESDLNVADMVLVPSSVHGNVSESEYQHVLDHFFSKVVVDTESFVFLPVFFDRFKKFFRGIGVFPERLFDDDTIDAALEDITMFFEVFGDGNKDGRGESEIEKTIAFLGLIRRFYLVEVPVEVIEGLAVFIAARNICG